MARHAVSAAVAAANERAGLAAEGGLLQQVDRLMALPAGLSDLSHLSGANRWRETLLLRLPHAVPGLISGLRLAVVYGPLAVLIGEWVGSSRGLGHLMLMANGRGQTALMFAALIVLAALSLLLWTAVEALARWAARRFYL